MAERVKTALYIVITSIALITIALGWWSTLVLANNDVKQNKAGVAALELDMTEVQTAQQVHKVEFATMQESIDRVEKSVEKAQESVDDKFDKILDELSKRPSPIP